MRISILAVGTRMPRWVTDGCNEYQKRMPGHVQVEIKEVEPGQRSGRSNPAGAIRKESERLLKLASAADLTIALDESGRQWGSEELAGQMQSWMQHSPNVALLIGGADGLSAACREQASGLWSLSQMTLPHGLVRVILAEQLYRAWTILQGHPYHRS
jgi:23S rRNA (pseudouridine1915-N3)-methyltransferase